MSEQMKPLIRDGAGTISLKIAPQDDNETVLLQDYDATVLLGDSNSTMQVEAGGVITSIPRELYQLPEGARLQNRYIVKDILGFGGFGITYSALDTTLDQRVAIKEYYPASLVNRTPGSHQVEVFSKKQMGEYQKGVRRFLEEARNMALFSKEEDIVNVYNYFEENGTAYLVMEYLDGMSLKAYTTKNGNNERLSAEETIRIIKSVIGALRKLHTKHIIHRDISPDNIFMLKSGVVKLIDFGAARFAGESEEAKALTIELKPGFAPKEQYQSKGKQGPWTDIYALGATMYRTLTGRMPDESVNREVGKDPLVEPKILEPSIPDSLNNIILRCMAIELQLRFQNVDELERALEGKKKVRSVKGELIARRAVRASVVAVIVAALGVFAWKEYEYIQNQYDKANLVPCTVTAAPLQTDNQEDVAAIFDSSIADFKSEYPYVDVKVVSDTASDTDAKGVFEMDMDEMAQQLKGGQLADLTEAYDLLDPSLYQFGDQLVEVTGKNVLPTGYNLPIIYRNTTVSDKAAENSKDAFLAGKSQYFVGTVLDYHEIQQKLAGIYEMKAVDKENERIELLGIWGVGKNADEDVQNASVRLVYYLSSEQAQDVEYLQRNNGIPLYKEAVDIFYSINPELEFLSNDALKLTTDNLGKLDQDYLNGVYQDL